MPEDQKPVAVNPDERPCKTLEELDTIGSDILKQFEEGRLFPCEVQYILSYVSSFMQSYVTEQQILENAKRRVMSHLLDRMTSAPIDPSEAN